MMIELDKEIRDFCKSLITTMNIYCHITENNRNRRSYVVNGVFLENDIVSNIASIYVKDQEPLYWDYYDEDLEQWYLPKKEFVEIFCKFAKDVEDVQNIKEFQDLNELRAVLNSNNFRL